MLMVFQSSGRHNGRPVRLKNINRSFTGKNMTIVKRFIAGAVCPRCSEMDKLKAWVEDDVQYRECVACGFTDEMSLTAPPVEEPATRVNQSQPDPKDEIQVVNLMDPKAK